MTAIGIDLGTTNSAAGYCEPDRREPRILPTSAGENLTPSVVSCRKSQRDPNAADLLVGRAALSNAVKAPADTVFSIKRLIGRTFQEEKVALVREKFNFEVVPAPGGGPGLCVRLGGRDYTPVDVSARILKKIKEDAARALGKDVTHAVITVPAYFEERQRAATREAGAQAGLVVKKIIDEPTAAAIAFGVQARPGGHHRILVYDLGGGTFDISILLMVKDAEGRDQFQVLQIEGDNWLGGDDFDRMIIDRMIESVRQAGADPATDKRFLLLAKQHAEQAKRALSAGTETEIVLGAAVRHPSGAMMDVELKLTRAEFEDMIRPFVDKSMDLVKKALSEQQLEPNDISDVLMVGGSTLVPLVYQTVQRFFGADKVRQTVNPMECVALGASVLAATLKGVACPNLVPDPESKDKKKECNALNDYAAEKCVKCGGSLASARSVGDTGVTEVTAMALGIAAVKGTQADVFVPIIPKSTPYPLREPMKQTFLAPAAGKVICVPVYEGDDAVASKNEEQGKIVFEVPTDIPSTTPVEVSFNYDRNRELTVTIRVQGTKFEKKETLRRDQPRTPKPAAAKEAASWQDELEQTCVFVQTFLERYRSFMDVSQASKAESDLRRAREVLAYPDEKEGKKFNRVLTMDVFNAGLATQLFLAENAMEGAAADIRDRISRAVRELREAHGRGDQARVRQIEGVLRTAVAQVLERREGVKKIEDTKDYGGLLRLLGDAGPGTERKGDGP